MQNKVNGFHWQKNVLINRANDFGFRKTMSEFSHFCVERTEPVGKGQLLESAIFTGRFDSASNWHPLVTPSIPRILKTNGTQGIPDPWKRFQALTNCISEDDTQHPIKKVKDRFQHEKKYPSSTSKFLWPGNLFELSGLVAFFQKTSHVDSKIHPILKPPRHPFFQGEKRPGTDFSGQDFGFRRWFRHAKGCLISRGWEENQLHKVCGEKNADFLLGGLELKMILLPPNAAKERKRQRLDHQPVPCLRIDCTGGRSRGKACRRCSCFTGELYLKNCLYLCHNSYITYHYIWYLWEVDCVLCIWHIYSQMCTISL